MGSWNDASSAIAKVELFLKDHLGEPIKNLKVEIRGLGGKADNIYHTGVTDAKGVLKFVAKKGEDITVHVKHWTRDEMKQIARLYPGLDNIRYLLQSPKVVKEVETQLESKAGYYKRAIHQIVSGETLSSIAQKYGTSVDLLKHINNLKDDLIKAGKQLKIPPIVSDSVRTIHDFNPSGEPTTQIEKGRAPVIFPVNVRPLNDVGGKWEFYLWTKDAKHGSQAVFGRSRDAGRRKHAARDLYLENYTPIVAIAPGTVISTSSFYMRTNALVVRHMTTDGRSFIINYGELDPKSITLKAGDPVTQGMELGKSGVLIAKNGRPAVIAQGQNISMLHFEYYSGELGDEGPFYGKELPEPYKRRRDIQDCLQILQEGYKATFVDAVANFSPREGRIPIAQLRLSEQGKNFIKAYEKLRLDYYDDAEGYCTVGWGHLVAYKSCASLSKSGGISLDEANAIFNEDVLKHEELVHSVITVPLYQHEFDALCSLAFNLGAIARKAPKLCKLINSQKYEQGAREFLDITNGGLKGLVKRRRQEYDMFMEAKYDSTH